MRRNQARVQMLALGLLGFLGLLSLDLAPVQAVMDDFLQDGVELSVAEVPVAEAAEQPAPTLRTAQGPSLAVRGPAEAPRKPCPACEAPNVIAVDVAAPQTAVAVQISTAFHEGRASQGFPASAGTFFLPTLWVDKPNTWPTIAAAEQALELSADQRVSWGRTFEDARRDMDDLRHVSNDQGETWHSISVSVVSAGGDLTKALAQAHRLAAFASSPLRGDETYREARVRIVRSYKGLLRADLTIEQQPIFDAHDVGPLFDRAHVALLIRSGTSSRGLVSRLRVIAS